MIDYIQNSHIIGVVNETIFLSADTPKQMRIFCQKIDGEAAVDFQNLEIFFAADFEFVGRCQNQCCCSAINLAFYSFNQQQTHIYAFADRFTIFRINISNGDVKIFGASVSDEILPPFIQHCYFCRQTQMNVFEHKNNNNDDDIQIKLLIYDRKCDNEVLFRKNREIVVDNAFVSVTKVSFSLNKEEAKVEKIAIKLPFPSVKFICPLDIQENKWILVDDVNKIVHINLMKLSTSEKSILYYCTVSGIYKPNYETQMKMNENKFYIFFDNQQLKCVINDNSKNFKMFNVLLNNNENLYNFSSTKKCALAFHPILLEPFKNLPILSNRSSLSFEQSKNLFVNDQANNILMNSLEIIRYETSKITTNLADLLEQFQHDNELKKFCSCLSCQQTKRSSFSILIDETFALRQRLQQMSIWSENGEIQENCHNNNNNKVVDETLNTTTTINDSPFSDVVQRTSITKNQLQRRRSTMLIQSPIYHPAERVNYAEKIEQQSTEIKSCCYNSANNNTKLPSSFTSNKRSTMLIFKPDYYNEAERVNYAKKIAQTPTTTITATKTKSCRNNNENNLLTTKSCQTIGNNNNNNNRSTMLISTSDLYHGNDEENVKYAELKHFEVFKNSPTTTIKKSCHNTNNNTSTKRSTMLISSPEFYRGEEFSYAEIKESCCCVTPQLVAKTTTTTTPQRKFQKCFEKYFPTTNSTTDSGLTESPYSTNEISVNFFENNDDSFQNVTLRKKSNINTNNNKEVAEDITTLSSLTQVLRSSQTFEDEEEDELNLNKSFLNPLSKNTSSTKSSQQENFEKESDLFDTGFYEYENEEMNSLEIYEKQSRYSFITSAVSINSNLYNSLDNSLDE